MWLIYLVLENKNCVIRLLLPGYGSTFLFSPSDAATTSYFCGCRESNCAVITSPVPWGPTVKQQLSLLHPMNLIWVTGLLHFDPTVVILWNSIRGTSLCFRREDQEHDLVETWQAHTTLLPWLLVFDIWHGVPPRPSLSLCLHLVLARHHGKSFQCFLEGCFCTRKKECAKHGGRNMVTV